MDMIILSIGASLIILADLEADWWNKIMLAGCMAAYYHTGDLSILMMIQLLPLISNQHWRRAVCIMYLAARCWNALDGQYYPSLVV